MTQDFKTKLQELIDNAADKFNDRNEVDFDYSCPYSFKQGAAFLMPMIVMLVEQRNQYMSASRYPQMDGHSQRKINSDNELLNLLKGEK